MLSRPEEQPRQATAQGEGDHERPTVATHKTQNEPTPPAGPSKTGIQQEDLTTRKSTAREEHLTKAIMSRKDSNVFSKIVETIGAFGDLNLVEKTDTLTGTFKVKRKTNRKGIDSVKANFFFKDEAFSGLGFKKVTFKDKLTNSIFGDATNPRTVRSGNKKYDYFDGTKKIVELSIEPEYLEKFEQGKKHKGFFRANLDEDDNFIAMSTGNRENFQDNKILTADFEIPLMQQLDIATHALL